MKTCKDMDIIRRNGRKNHGKKMERNFTIEKSNEIISEGNENPERVTKKAGIIRMAEICLTSLFDQCIICRSNASYQPIK